MYWSNDAETSVMHVFRQVWFARGLLSLAQLHEEYPALTHNATLEARVRGTIIGHARNNM